MRWIFLAPFVVLSSFCLGQDVGESNDSLIFSFQFQGVPESLEIPDGASYVKIDARGAQGAAGNGTQVDGGRGARVVGLIELEEIPVNTIHLVVGGQNGFNEGGAGGFGSGD